MFNWKRSKIDRSLSLCCLLFVLCSFEMVCKYLHSKTLYCFFRAVQTFLHLSVHHNESPTLPMSHRVVQCSSAEQSGQHTLKGESVKQLVWQFVHMTVSSCGCTAWLLIGNRSVVKAAHSFLMTVAMLEAHVPPVASQRYE